VSIEKLHITNIAGEATLEKRRLLKRNTGEYLNIIQLMIKRFFDMVASVLLIVICAPILFILGLSVKVSSKGPVYFRQRRIGLNGRPFQIYKFRTMRNEDSDEDHKHYIRYLLTEGIDAENKIEFVTKYVHHVEDRITCIGRFLRLTSMDELPQLYNIFLGQMSFVGPRPHPDYEVCEYKEWYNRRLEVKPGLTGWSKLNLRLTPQNYEESIMYDIWYVDHWSLWMDMRIIIKTIPFVLSMEGAH